MYWVVHPQQPRDFLRLEGQFSPIHPDSRQCTAIFSSLIHLEGCIRKYIPIAQVILTVLKSILSTLRGENVKSIKNLSNSRIFKSTSLASQAEIQPSWVTMLNPAPAWTLLSSGNPQVAALVPDQSLLPPPLPYHYPPLKHTLLIHTLLISVTGCSRSDGSPSVSEWVSE